MRLLLDTHIWIWYVTGSADLPVDVRDVIESDGNEVFLSPISVWETLLLAEKGRFGTVADPVDWVRRALREFQTIEAPLNTEIAILSRSIDLKHSDPADRFLAATARVYEARLVTLDRRLIESEAVSTSL